LNNNKELLFDHCQVCGKKDYITEASYTKHTGMVIIGTTQRYKGYMCKKCIRSLFNSCEIHCALTGWWGLVSLFIYNPIALIGNVIMYFRANKRFNFANKQLVSDDGLIEK
jgi:hypothetical protein